MLKPMLRFSFAALAVVSFCTAESQAAVLLGPTPYLAFDNTLPGAGTSISPFSGLTFSYFHNETFEDRLLNSPGLSTSPGFGGNVTLPGQSIRDSVDADDGQIDGSGSAGYSYFTSQGSRGLSFRFDAGILGMLPTHAGLVWTDGLFNRVIEFEAFGANDESLGVISANGIPDNSITGTTAEDRFFGVIHAGGISRIFIRNPGGGIEVDHIQYGYMGNQNQAVPEPASLCLWGVAGMLAVCMTRRHRSTMV